MTRNEISKIVPGHLEEHNKLGLQPKFQKFLVTGDLEIQKVFRKYSINFQPMPEWIHPYLSPDILLVVI